MTNGNGTGNSRFTGEITLCSREELFWYFDKLPKEIRAALCEAVEDWDMKSITAAYRLVKNKTQSQRLVVAVMRGQIEQQDTQSIVNFATRYTEQHNAPYPHLAAGVSVQRYGEWL